jgi:hypothetical protein
MEGALARWYASLTKKSLEDFRVLAARIAAQIPPQSSVLLGAPGPGYFATNWRGSVTIQSSGFDVSQTFVEMARATAANANIPVALWARQRFAHAIRRRIVRLLSRLYKERVEQMIHEAKFRDRDIREGLMGFEILLSRDRES